MEKCNYFFKKGWYCTRSRNHEGPCCLFEIRSWKTRLRRAWHELTTRMGHD
ncbi:hypothetical protein SEA_ATUIN_106 [Arthrobacter phage Atuin]|nr:hypothetical protein SEA_ATUIN_205 [Arthrobacter phage Atuin]